MRNQPAVKKEEESKEDKKENAFVGQGNSLSGPPKKQKEVIEID